MMETIPIDWAQGHLVEIAEKLHPGDEVVLTRDDQSVAMLRAAPSNKPYSVPGRGKGMLTIFAEDEEQL